MKRIIIICAALVVLLSVLLSCGSSSNDSKSCSSDPAKITLDEAKEIALNSVKGTITDAELSCDKGRLIYDVIVMLNGAAYGFMIDAMTGEVIKIEYN